MNPKKVDSRMLAQPLVKSMRVYGGALEVHHTDGTVALLNPLVGAPPEAGTLLRQFCNGLNLIGVFADGSGGEYNEMLEFNSINCGFTSYTLSVSVLSANSVSTNLEVVAGTVGVPNGTTMYYTLEGVTASDTIDGTLGGGLVIQDGGITFNKSIKSDILGVASGTTVPVTVRLRTESLAGPIVATAQVDVTDTAPVLPTVYEITSSQQWTAPDDGTVDALIVAGGGGGGSTMGYVSFFSDGGGGGGAGGVLRVSFNVTQGQTLSAVIGAGGAGGTAFPNGQGGKGGNSSFGGQIAIGGGGGGGDGQTGSTEVYVPGHWTEGETQTWIPETWETVYTKTTNGASGGSGGGACAAFGVGSPGQGTAGQGHAGGGQSDDGLNGSGGGASAVGGSSGTGSGGAGSTQAFTAVDGAHSYTVGGGGGAGGGFANGSPEAPAGGAGGGGAGGAPFGGTGGAGSTNTGGGGGGGGGLWANGGGAGGAGGSGLVVIAFQKTNN